jgi:hypothetical protein
MKIKACCILLILFSIQISQAQNWQSMNGGANDEIKSLFADTVNNIVYTTGFFTNIGGINARYLAKWDGVVWDSIGNGIPNTTSSRHAFDIYNGNLVLMSTIFHPWHSQIAQWNGTGWDSIGANFRDDFLGVKVLNNELYTYGEFSVKNGITYNGIAKWDGTNWISVGFPYNNGTNPPLIRCIAMYHGELYAGGLFFDSLGGDANIAKFNGSYWSIVGDGIHGFMDQVGDMEVYQDELYIAGDFKVSSGNLSNGILRWDGTTLKDVGGGITTNLAYNMIEDIVVMDNKLYAGGHFEEIGSVPANDIASWDGTNWCGFSNANNPSVSCLTSMNHELYLATNVEWDSDTVNFIAKSNGIPIADSCGHISVGIEESTNPVQSIHIYPNPASNQITIEFNLISNKNTSIEVKNILGQTVQKTENHCLKGQNAIKIQFNSLPAGVYFIQLTYGNKIYCNKIIKQ